MAYGYTLKADKYLHKKLCYRATRYVSQKYCQLLHNGVHMLHMVQLKPLRPKTPSSLSSFKSRVVQQIEVKESGHYVDRRVINYVRPATTCSSS